MKPLTVALIAGGLLLMTAKKTSETASANEKKFAPALRAAEIKYGIPENILRNMARTESNFNPNAVGPMTRYGQAKGILQIMPMFHPGVNPLDPLASIDYAGNYLRDLYRQFKTWEKAVAAYNWGPGNVKSKWPNMPPETRNYVKKVLG